MFTEDTYYCDLSDSQLQQLISLLSAASFTTLTICANAVATEAFLTGKNYLTALPAIASFTTLTIGANAVATEVFVTGKNYLTALPMTANFTTLANNAVATQS